MPTQITVLEYSTPVVKDGIIAGVKVLGQKSSHGWIYPTEVLRAAKELYEEAPVFVLHPDAREKKQGHRQLRDHFGALRNVRETGTGLFADLAIKPSHPLAAQLLEQAPSCGLSHNAIVEMDDVLKTVTRIVSVNSVDLVDNPATNKNLFEEKIMPEIQEAFVEEMRAFKIKTEAYMAAAATTAVTEGPTLPPRRLTSLENKGDADGDKPPIGNDHEAFMDQVRGFSVSK